MGTLPDLTPEPVVSSRDVHAAPDIDAEPNVPELKSEPAVPDVRAESHVPDPKAESAEPESTSGSAATPPEPVAIAETTPDEAALISALADEHVTSEREETSAAAIEEATSSEIGPLTNVLNVTPMAITRTICIQIPRAGTVKEHGVAGSAVRCGRRQRARDSTENGYSQRDRTRQSRVGPA